jgi:hypothetical protein
MYRRQGRFSDMDATEAPICTEGPSRPSGIVAEMARQIPIARHAKVFH